MERTIDDVLTLFDSSEEMEEMLPLMNDQTISIEIRHEYPPQFLRSVNILRYVINNDEYSERGMLLTEFIIRDMKNHYAAWIYRREFLKRRSSKELTMKELDFCEKIILEEPKGFQSWEHKRFCIEELAEANYEKEINFLQKIFDKDSKNYHGWSFRVWLTRKFKFFVPELKLINDTLSNEISNNSIWAYRKFLSKNLQISAAEEESFVFKILESNLKNESGWYYLDDIFEKRNEFSADLKEFCLSKESEQKTNRFILTYLIFNEIRLAREEWDRKLIDSSLEKLRTVHDPLRKAYWSFFEENYII